MLNLVLKRMSIKENLDELMVLIQNDIQIDDDQLTDYFSRLSISRQTLESINEDISE